MSSAHMLEQIARTVLYEGYILWPYRRSAIKNQQRWTFGGVFPDSFASQSGGTDRSTVCADVVVEAPVDVDDAIDAKIDVSLRFLHVVSRQLMRVDDDGRRAVEELSVGRERYLSWDETTEREIRLSCELETSNEIVAPIAIPAGVREEMLLDDGKLVGIIVRSWRSIDGMMSVTVRGIPQKATDRRNAFRVTITVRNDTHWHGASADRDDAIRQSLVSAHVAMESARAEFVSTIDPPAEYGAISKRLHNIGLWPALVGVAPDRRAMLAAPIILGDYPRIAPESPGDLFDGGEIDQLLILNVLALTDDEQAEMRDTDPRAREILERCRGLSNEQLIRLHATVRSERYLEPPPFTFRAEGEHGQHLG